jgi:hypothetical protein
MNQMTEAPTLEKIYREVLTTRDKLDNLKKLMAPTEKVSPEEAAEIKALKDEAERGETVPWTQVKAKSKHHNI